MWGQKRQLSGGGRRLEEEYTSHLLAGGSGSSVGRGRNLQDEEEGKRNIVQDVEERNTSRVPVSCEPLFGEGTGECKNHQCDFKKQNRLTFAICIFTLFQRMRQRVENLEMESVRESSPNNVKMNTCCEPLGG